MKRYLSILLAAAMTVISSWAQEPIFNRAHGIYDQPFTLTIRSVLSGASIFFTTDGSDPRVKGSPYDGAMSIRSTTILRAATRLPDLTWSTVTTASYIFPASLATQSNRPYGYPTTWGNFCQIQGVAPADYEMDPDMMNDDVLRSKILQSMHTLPVVSLVTERDNFFSKERNDSTGGIYIYTGCPVGDGIGRGWERPISLEYFGTDAYCNFTIDCCVKLHGGHGRLPEKNPKHAMRLHFKSAYGPSKLRYPVFGDKGPAVFNSIVLRTFFGYSWQHWDNNHRFRAQYCRDAWARFTQAKMGHPISTSQYVHLYINGMYWGLYNLCERVDEHFCAQKLGGKPEDWDVTEVDGGAGQYYAAIPTCGSIQDWNQMVDYIYSLPDRHENYLHLIGLDAQGQPSPEYPPLLDVDNFIDYMLINLYGGNTDWDHHNWFAYRNRTLANHGFRFLCWDTEGIFIQPTENLTSKNNRGCPTGFMNRLMKDRLFAHRFHEIAQQRLFYGGALTPESVVQTWDSLSTRINLALYAESARWGDYRRDVHPYSSKGGLYTVDNQYMIERRRLLSTYFPRRTEILLDQLRTRGWFPQTPAPEVLLNDVPIGYGITTVQQGDVFTLSGDDIYFTTDGTDPVTWEKHSAGTIHATAMLYEGENLLNGFSWESIKDTITIKAIAQHNGEWSPIVTTRLTPQPDPDFVSLPNPTKGQPGKLFDLSGRPVPFYPRGKSFHHLPRGIYIQQGAKVLNP